MNRNFAGISRTGIFSSARDEAGSFETQLRRSAVFDIFNFMLNVSTSSKPNCVTDSCIVSAYLINQSLCICLSNKEKWLVDLSIYFNSAPAAAVLSDRTYAVKMRVEPQAIKWPNGFKLSIKSILAHGTQEKTRAA